MRRTIPLRFPVELPGGTLESVTIDLSRPIRGGDVLIIAGICGLPPALLGELAEHDYLRILLAIDELNAPLLETA